MARRRSAGPDVVASACGVRKRKTANHCREMLQERLSAEFGGIIEAFVKAAMKGSASHMKLATEFLEGRPGRSPRGGSAAKLLRAIERAESSGD